jgi:hypothetical protein
MMTALIFTGCRPKSTPAALVSDGTILLLKNGATNAAVVITRQKSESEAVDYQWILRCDGKSTFDPKDTACVTGYVSSAKSIAFGSFDIAWSIAGSSGGYVYYPSAVRYIKMPWGKYWSYKTIGGQELAVTTERNLAKIDANDPRWKYKR